MSLTALDLCQPRRPCSPHFPTLEPEESFRARDPHNSRPCKPAMQLPKTFDTLAGPRLRLTRKSVVEAPGEAADGLHFQFRKIHRNQDREASILPAAEGRLAGFIAASGVRYELRSLRSVPAIASLAGAASELPCGMSDEHRAPAKTPAGDGGLAGIGSDDGSLINVYVAYTDAAVAQAGGEPQMLDQILWAVGDVQHDLCKLRHSRAGLQLRGTERASGYVESPTAMANDLYALRDPADGVLDAVLANATWQGADLTALVRADGGGACGLAFPASGGSTADVDYGVSADEPHLDASRIAPSPTRNSGTTWAAAAPWRRRRLHVWRRLPLLDQATDSSEQIGCSIAL
jgi:hypothetical protein